MRSKKSKSVWICLLVAMLLSMGTAAEAAPITWITQCVFSLQLPLSQAYLSWAKKVEEMSGGRLLIEVHGEGEIVPPASSFESVRDGVIDAAMNSPAWQRGQYPAGDFFYTLPGGITETMDLLTWAFTEGRIIQQEMYGNNVIIFPIGLTPPEVFWATREIKTLADMKGLKMRASGLAMDLFTKLGVSCVSLPGGEVVPSLRRGVIDAAEFCFPSMDEGLGIPEVAKFMIVPPIHAGANIFQLFINPQKWAELPDDLKAIVSNAAYAATIEVFAQQMADQAPCIERLKAAGITFCKLPVEDQRVVRTMMLEIIEEKAKNDKWIGRVWESQKKLVENLQTFSNLTNFDK